MTASTFFKLRELYFNDQIDNAEYSGKLYGLGQTFSPTNGLADPGRGGATLAERDDRGSASRDVHNQTPSVGVGGQQNQGMPMGMPTMPSGAMPPVGGYGPFMRTTIGGR